MPARKIHYNDLLDDFSYDASADGTTAFADSETQTVFHRDGFDQGNSHLNVVTWHYHFNAFWQLAVTSYVSSTEVELWTVAFEEWSVTTAFFFGQNVNFCSRTWCAA